MLKTRTHDNGRFGNQLFRNLAVSFIAEKHDLKVVYSSHKQIKKLGIDLYSGRKVFNNTIQLTDDNYFSILENPLFSNLNPNLNYFQTSEISMMIFNYLKTMQQNIIHNNPFSSRYKENNDLFIHIRLGDVSQFNPGSPYYLKIISSLYLSCNQIIYISTDEPNHSILHDIKKIYPVSIIDKTEVEIIQFGSTCRYVILSHGSFSSIIGYFSFFSKVFFPSHSAIKWYGDTFSIPGWEEIKV
jgi:hypothetical protein